MMMTIQEYLETVSEVRRENPTWRLGQTYFNVLHDVAPNLANKVRGTVADPFHDDENLPTFLSWLTQELD